MLEGASHIREVAQTWEVSHDREVSHNREVSILGSSPIVGRSPMWGVPLLLGKSHVLGRSILGRFFCPREIFNAGDACDTVGSSAPNTLTKFLGAPRRFHKR